MKIIGINNNYHTEEKSPALFLMADSSLLKDGKPFFLPSFDNDFRMYPSVVIKICRLGKNIAKRFDIDPRRTASLLDTTSCTVQGLIPYGAQLLMASGIAGISALSIVPYLYYPMLIGVTVLATILLPIKKNKH